MSSINPNLKVNFLNQIDELKMEYTILKARANYDDLSDLPIDRILSLRTRIVTSIIRITGKNSEYYIKIKDINDRTDINDYDKLKYFMGPLDALYQDIQNDYIKTLSELIHGDVFSDYLDMAGYLLNESYKDAAAVIAGSTLEEHLRKLCQKSGLSTQNQVISGSKPKKADVLNSDLARQNIYTKSEQKQVTAWLGIRNDAAHGNYGKYSDEEVKLLIMGLRDFFIRNPT